MCICKEVLIEKTRDYESIKAKSFNEEDFQKKFRTTFSKSLVNTGQDEMETTIIKRFVMIEKAGIKGTFPNKNNPFLSLVYETKKGTNLNVMYRDSGTGTLKSLDDTIVYYEDIEKALQSLKCAY